MEMEQESPELAEQYARTHARDKGAPPHWLRCNFMAIDPEEGTKLRCKLGSGHTGLHVYEDRRSG